MFWMWILAVFVILVVLAVIGIEACKKHATSTGESQYKAAFIEAVGGESAFERLGFIFPETLIWLIEEYNRISAKEKGEDEEYDRRESALYLESVEKREKVPKPDGAPETELLRREALEASVRAFGKVQSVRLEWEHVRKRRASVSELIQQAQIKDWACLLWEGVVVHDQCDTRNLRRIYRLRDGRYFLVIFREFGDGEKIDANNVYCCRSDWGQFSKAELRAVIADKAVQKRAQSSL